MKIIFQTSDKTDSRVDQLIDRSEIEDKYKWRLQDIFKDDSEWEDAYTQIESMLPDITDYQGRLGKSAQTLYECLKLRDQIEEQFGRLYLYAGLNNDKDTRVGKYQEFRSRASSLMAKVNQTTSFIQPEILSIPEDTLDEFVESNQQLNTYRHYFDDLLRSKDHVLPPKQERLLAMTGEIAQGPYHIFSMFNNADIKFPTVRDENDQEMELTKGRYQKLMESQHRRVRKDSFDAFYGTYGEWTNTLAATLSTAIKRNIFYARARKYNNALEAALDADYIPVQVYDNVVNTINENLEPLHKYMCLRKKMLELDELHPWDLAVPLIHDVNFDIPYEETQETITNALKPLGEDYLSVLQKGFANGWIDVYENHGKRSGAFSWATYGVHPYILLNYN
ncbi:MAG: oligoendopeptidase F, partial [Aliifodinibius sp.]|nr:oligoendopeptidase F family protein [Fodinibius sp.]NIV14686.1 oligoendopeptidase F [Fodinibius sp.]NIY28584.1 oligoendopeptidase F [Fodinibius sp.]